MYPFPAELIFSTSAKLYSSPSKSHRRSSSKFILILLSPVKFNENDLNNLVVDNELIVIPSFRKWQASSLVIGYLYIFGFTILRQIDHSLTSIFRTFLKIKYDAWYAWN